MSDADAAVSSAARTLLAAGSTAAHLRASALASRQDLETGLELFWASRAPGVAACSTKAQIACLQSFLNNGIHSVASFARGVLSRASHHHVYELPPTVPELSAAITAVERVVSALAAPSDVAGQPE